MFQVLKIIDVRYTKSDKREFLIRWKNYSPKQDSWEPEENLSCDELISKFLEDQDKVNIYMAQNRFSGENIFNYVHFHTPSSISHENDKFSFSSDSFAEV